MKREKHKVVSFAILLRSEAEPTDREWPGSYYIFGEMRSLRELDIEAMVDLAIDQGETLVEGDVLVAISGKKLSVHICGYDNQWTMAEGRTGSFASLFADLGRIVARQQHMH